MSAMIVEDKGQKSGQHEEKHKWFECNNITLFQAPLPVGDYIIATEDVLDVIKRKSKRGVEIKKMDFLGSYSVSVDTKKDMQEIAGNICGKAHARFRDECILSQNNGIKLYVLIENEDGIQSIEDVFLWQNPRMQRYNKIEYMHSIGKWKNILLPKAKPTSGETLAKAMLTMQSKYKCEFVFTTPKESANVILKLLKTEVENCHVNFV